MTRVLVIYGGSSDEREVSLRSGKNVADALQQCGYEVGLYDPADSTESLHEASAGFDVAFPALHGKGGEDGAIQNQLDRIGIAYVGSTVYPSELCFDKWNYRDLLTDYGLPVARGDLVNNEKFWNSELIQKPFVLKPPKGGSSIDTILVHDTAAMPKEAIEKLFAKHVQLLVEELIVGHEITVGVLGDQALQVIEIIPPQGKDFDYENKYNGATQELCPPENVSGEVQKNAQDLALKIHTLCGCQDLSRTDMIVASDGSLTVLETNTIPGLTEQSLLPKAAVAAGLNMSQLCDQLVHMAMTRRTAAA